jgi:hypothetical protein
MVDRTQQSRRSQYPDRIDAIRRLAVGNLPDDGAPVEIERRDPPVRRLYECQALDPNPPLPRPTPAAVGATPRTYAKSLTVESEGTRPSDVTNVEEWTYNRCVSGSYEPPAQFAPARFDGMPPA